MNAGPGHSSAAEGDTNDAVDGVRPNEARVARWAAHARTLTVSLPRPWITATAPTKTATTQQGAATARIFVLVPGGRSRSVPVPRADAASRVFAFVEDLFFLSKIQATGQKMNVKSSSSRTKKNYRSYEEQR